MGRLIAMLFVAAATQFAFASLAAAAERIVSIGGSVTEIVYALGAGGAIVAADTTSVHPGATAALPKVGYMRQIAAEPILALKPDLVLVSADAGPASVLEQIAAAGVPVTIVPETPNPAGVIEKIRHVAAAIGRQAAGEALIDEVEQGFETLASALASAHDRPTVLYLLAFTDNAPMAAGSGTAADGIIALAGGSNAVTGYDGYKPLSPEAAAMLDPALVVVSSHGIAMAGGIEAMQNRPDLGAIPAVRQGRILVMDANYLLGFGPRAAQAARDLAARLHPNLVAATP